jgi:glycosyltransferase involved in cell wall biosynthesis
MTRRASFKGGQPIKVLFLIDSLWGAGGAEVSLLRLIERLPRERYQCRVITFHSDEVAKQFVARFPCPVEIWPMTSYLHASTLGMMNRLRRLVRQEKFDIVHSFFPASDLLFGPIAKLSGARVLISSRRDMGIVRQAWHRPAYRLVRQMYDQVHAVSEEVRRYAIRSDGLDPRRVVTIHNGVDANMRVERVQPEDCPGQLVVSMVANVRRVKGIDIFLHTAGLVKARFPNTKFRIAGIFGTNVEHLAYKDEVLRLRKTLNLEKQVDFLGASTQVPEFLASSDVFVLPSRSEGFSNALLEAMVCGLPAIATEVGGNPEILEDGVSGFLVPTEDPVAIADRIMRLLADPELRRRLGKAGRDRVLERFTIEMMVNRVIAAYELLLSGTPHFKLATPAPLKVDAV